MKTSRIIFAAVFAGALLASCAPKEEQELISDLPGIVAEAQPMFVSINASKAIDTKALAIVGTALKSTWEDGETVGVYKVGDSNTKYGTLAPATFGSNTTRLEGTIDVAGLSAGDQLFLLYPDRPWYYYGQDGTLATISSSYDFATATVAISSVDSDHLSAESAAFSNKQAIVKFSLKEKGAGAISASGFTIFSKNKKLVSSYNLLFEPDESDNLSVKLNSEAPVSELTLAVATSGGAADDYGFYASTKDASFNETLYEFIKEGVTFENGKYYTVNLSNLEEVHYVAAGSPASVFGEEWTPTRAANELDFNGSYFATSLGIPGPCQIEFKVVRNGTAYYPFPEGGPETNIKVGALGKGSINIVMDPITKNVSYKVYYDSTPETSWTVAGAVGGVTDGGQDDPVFGKTWDPFVTANDMTASGSKFVKTFSAVPAGTEMEFKIVKDRDWNGEVYGGSENSNYYYKVLADGDVTITFDPAGPTITVDGPSAPADVYRVVGSSKGADAAADDTIFGKAWDTTITANDLVKQADGTYTKSFDIPTCMPIAFKVVNVDTNEWYGDGENNIEVAAKAAGTLTVTFNPSTGEVTGAMTYNPDPGDIYTVAGTSGVFTGSIDETFVNAWDPFLKLNDMTLVGDKYMLSFYYINAGTTLTFKIVKNRDWKTAYPADDNYVELIEYEGEVTIIFDPATADITVIKPSAPEYLLYVLDEKICKTDSWGTDRTIYMVTGPDSGVEATVKHTKLFGTYEYNGFLLDNSLIGKDAVIYYKGENNSEVKITVPIVAGTYFYYVRTDGILYSTSADGESPSALASETTQKIYVRSDNAPYIYMWNAGGDAAAWPGTVGTKIESKEYNHFWYSFDVVPGMTRFILNNNAGQQSGDLFFGDYPADNGNYYFYWYPGQIAPVLEYPLGVDAPNPVVTIDGDFSEWASVTEFSGTPRNNGGDNTRINKWKVTSDSQNVYFYFELVSGKFAGKPGSYFYLGFDTDNDVTTGGTYGNVPGVEQYAVIYPFVADSDPVVFVTGEDNRSTVNGSWSGKLKTWGVNNGTVSYVEVSIPREAISLTDAQAIKVGASFQEYDTLMQSITLP